MSKGYDLKKIISNWEKEGTLEQKIEALEKIPEKCLYCNNGTIRYWDETDEEIIFRCLKCKNYLSISFEQNSLKFYFSY